MQRRWRGCAPGAGVDGVVLSRGDNYAQSFDQAGGAAARARTRASCGHNTPADARVMKLTRNRIRSGEKLEAETQTAEARVTGPYDNPPCYPTR